VYVANHASWMDVPYAAQLPISPKPKVIRLFKDIKG
jgi:1-acyl-sn-glycerol-3-phosphate acyltransferase